MRKPLILLLLTLQAAATRIYHRPLEQVLTPEVGVVQARLAHVRTQQTAGTYHIYCRLQNPQILRGAPPATEIEHSFSTLLQTGNTRRSPIRDGSGLETNLQENTPYYFLLDPTGHTLIRVEPETSRAKIETLLTPGVFQNPAK